MWATISTWPLAASWATAVIRPSGPEKTGMLEAESVTGKVTDGTGGWLSGLAYRPRRAAASRPARSAVLAYSWRAFYLVRLPVTWWRLKGSTHEPPTICVLARLRHVQCRCQAADRLPR